MRRVSAKRGSCIMTTDQLIPRNWFKLSWPNTTFLWFDRLPTLPTWLLAFYGCSPSWKRSWKRRDLSYETTLFGTRLPNCTPFAKRHSRNALSNGGTAGRIVFSHKETISKGISVADLKACKCIFAGQMSDTIWTALVLFKWRKMFLLRHSRISTRLYGVTSGNLLIITYIAVRQCI